uniref:Uncharacterized protein n=1 Tax=Aegilops tauschii subsp. strangulata TaxID=200361 RepID=A0A453PW73_AEGTS
MSLTAYAVSPFYGKKKDKYCSRIIVSTNLQTNTILVELFTAAWFPPFFVDSCLYSAKLRENLRAGPCREPQAGGGGEEESPDGSRTREGEGSRRSQEGGVAGARSFRPMTDPSSKLDTTYFH